MASPDLDEPADRESNASAEAAGSSFPGGCADGLGLLVWLGQLARDESARRPSRSAAAELLDAPRSIGRFQLEALLGTGAYGAVFRALDTQLDRQVALKIAWPGVLMDPVAGRRFLDEPKTVAALKHRGIVEVYDSGEIEMAAFIALELIDGPTLGWWLKRQEHIRPRLAAQIVRSVAEAIQFAHERGIVHRDLKPGNILLRPCDGGNACGFEPVVTDFGLARRPRISDRSLLTATHAIIGTDHYMSPEQAAGRKDDVGPASDIFSLGVILYELVAGRRPFDGDSSEQVRQRIQQDEPAPIRPWRKGVPKDLETIALRCLEKTPSRRYGSARELADDLGRFLDGKPIVARPVGLMQRGWKFARRKPLAISIVSLAVVSLLTIAGLAGAWIADRANSARRIAEVETAAATADALQRQQEYVANIRRAAEVLERGGRRELLEHLEKCRSIAQAPVRCGIEWEWLWAQTISADVTLNAHPKGVKSVRFHPAGDRLTTAGKDGRIFIWDVATWTRRRELRYSDDAEVTVTEFSADGSLLAAGGEDGRVAIYRFANGEVVFDEQVIDGRVFELAWIGDTTELAVGGDGATLWVIDAIAGTRRSKTLDIPEASRKRDPARVPEIVGLAYAAKTNSLTVLLTPAAAHTLDPTSLDARPTGLRDRPPLVGAACPLASGYFGTSAINNITIWTTADGTEVAKVEFPRHIQCMRYSAAAQAVVVGFRDGTIEVCDFDVMLREGKSSRRYCAHIGRAISVDVSLDGSWLASGGSDGEVKLYRRRAARGTYDVPLPGMPFRIRFSPCGRWLAVSHLLPNLQGRISVFNARTGERLWSAECLPRPGNPPDPPQFSGHELWNFNTSGDALLMADLEGSFHLRDARTGIVKKVYSVGDDSQICRIQSTPDDRSLFIHRLSGDALVVDRSSGAIVDRAPSTCVGAFRTIRGDLWLDRDESLNLVLRDAPSGKTVLQLPGLADRPEVAAISRDGRYLAVGGFDRVVYCWNLASGGLPDKCVGHEREIMDVKFSSDGRTILSRGMDQSVRFWDVTTQSELLVLGTPDEYFLAIDLCRDGNVLIGGVYHKPTGRYGLQIHRLGPNRESLPRNFEFPPIDAP